MSVLTVVGSGQVGTYYLVETANGTITLEDWKAIVERFPGCLIDVQSGPRTFFRVIRWIGGNAPVPEANRTNEPTVAPFRSGDERLKTGDAHDVLWARDGMAEIRFTEDGFCYVVKTEEATT